MLLYQSTYRTREQAVGFEVLWSVIKSDKSWRSQCCRTEPKQQSQRHADGKPDETFLPTFTMVNVNKVPHTHPLEHISHSPNVSKQPGGDHVVPRVLPTFE